MANGKWQKLIVMTVLRNGLEYPIDFSKHLKIQIKLNTENLQFQCLQTLYLQRNILLYWIN
jgi:hypothetical protein